MASTVPDTRIFKIANKEGQSEPGDQTVQNIEHGADYISEIRHSSSHGVDLVLDCHYDNNFHDDFNLLRPMGKYVAFGYRASAYRGIFDTIRWVSLNLFFLIINLTNLYNTGSSQWWGPKKLSLLKLSKANRGIYGFNLRRVLYFERDRSFVCKMFDEVCKMWQAGQIKALFDLILHLDDVSHSPRLKFI